MVNSEQDQIPADQQSAGPGSPAGNKAAGSNSPRTLQPLDPWPALAASSRRTSPLVTYVDAATGERTELSALSVQNGAAKIANALSLEFDLETSARVGLHLPWHWQRSLWWAGCAAAGVRILPYGDPGRVDLVVCTQQNAAACAAESLEEVVVVSLHPLGLPIREGLPTGCVDGTAIVRAQPDLFSPGPRGGATGIEVPVPADIPRGARTLVGCTDPLAADGWWWAMAIPLAVDGSIVMTTTTDESVLDRIGAQEQVDHTIVIS